jgi:hypothetical protein
MNVDRVILGGVVAAALIFVVAGLLPGLVLGSELQTWHQSLGNLYSPPPKSVAMALFILLSLVFGMLVVWLYAAIWRWSEDGFAGRIRALAVRMVYGSAGAYRFGGLTWPLFHVSAVFSELPSPRS